MNSEKRVTNSGFQAIAESLRAFKCLSDIKIDFLR